MAGGKILDRVELTLRDVSNGDLMPLWIDVYDNTLSRKWLQALTDLVDRGFHLEKNYCFMGFAAAPRNGEYLLQQINQSIDAINGADLGYHIDDHFSMDNTITKELIGDRWVDRSMRHERFNNLHRYFEDLQGVSGKVSEYYCRADSATRWHIRQLNLLCHEFECWALSWRKELDAPDWQRPSTLMCWLNAPRFTLETSDYELFGIDTINRPLGGVFVGVNKAVGKHHWEVFNDEGRDSRLSELTTTTLRSQTEAAGDFDIEWGQNPANYIWQQKKLDDFRQWLMSNGFDPDDRSLTIGHPQVAQVDLERSFGTSDYATIWNKLSNFLDVWQISVGGHSVCYDYHWSDSDYQSRQIKIIEENEKC